MFDLCRWLLFRVRTSSWTSPTRRTFFLFSGWHQRFLIMGVLLDRQELSRIYMSKAHDLDQLLTLIYIFPLQKLTLMVHSFLILHIMELDLKQAIGGDHVIVVTFINPDIYRIFISNGFRLRLFVLTQDTWGFRMLQVNNVPGVDELLEICLRNNLTIRNNFPLEKVLTHVYLVTFVNLIRIISSFWRWWPIVWGNEFSDLLIKYDVIRNMYVRVIFHVID